MELNDPALEPLMDPVSSRDATESLAKREVRGRLDWRAKIALLAGSTVVALLVAEVVVRLQPRLYSTGYVPARDPALVYELAPGHRIPSLGAQISWQGLNDRRFPLAKLRGVFRIAVVGDSTSFGWKVAREKSFPKVLERQLNDLRPNGFEVINFSVPGYNTTQELEVIRRKALAFRPDMVILVFTFNDVFLCNYFLPEITPLNFLAHRSYFVRLLLRTVDQWLGTPLGGSFAYPEPWLRFKREFLQMPFPEQWIYPQPGLEEVAYDQRNPPNAAERVPERYRYMLGYEAYRARLGEIRDLLAERGITFVSTGLFTADALRINRELGVEHIATGMRPAELAAAFPRRTAESLVLPNDGHFSADGHALAGRHLFLYLTRNGLVPGGRGT